MSVSNSEQTLFWREIEELLARAREVRPLHHAEALLDLGRLVEQGIPTPLIARLVEALEGWDGRLLAMVPDDALAPTLRSGDRLVIAGAIGYFAFDVAAIAAAFHAVGSAGLPIGLLVLAYTLGHGGAIVPIPGSAEGGLIGMFVLYGVSLPTATAAVLAYRALHAGVPMLLGAIGLADVRRLLRDPAHLGSRPTPETAPVLSPLAVPVGG